MAASQPTSPSDRDWATEEDCFANSPITEHQTWDGAVQPIIEGCRTVPLSSMAPPPLQPCNSLPPISTWDGSSPSPSNVQKPWRASARLSRLLICCATPSLERTRPLLRTLETNGVSVELCTEDNLVDDTWLTNDTLGIDAVLVIGSPFFQHAHEKRLLGLSEHASKAGALLLNNVSLLLDMKDRSKLLRKLSEHSIPTPPFVACVRNGDNNSVQQQQLVVEEHDDHVMISGKRINKPFLEKPLDRRDRAIYVYYPKTAGGGRALIASRESGDLLSCRRSNSWFEHAGRVRREGSFIYQEYMQSEGFQIQATCIGGLAFGYRVFSGVFAQSMLSTHEERACEVILRQEEKIIVAKLAMLLQQTVFGVTFVRYRAPHDGSTTSYVLDVWSGFPQALGIHMSDAVRELLKAMRVRLPRRGMHTRSRSCRPSGPKRSASACGDTADVEIPVRLHASETGIGNDVSSPVVSEPMSGRPNKGEPVEDLFAVMLIARHAERTPKQKIKVKIKLDSQFAAGFLCGWLAGEDVPVKKGLKLITTFELRSPEQIARLVNVTHTLEQEGHDVVSLRDGLRCITTVGMSCHAKIGVSEERLVVALKWGGELTETGASEAEEFGKSFRAMAYPLEEIDELHATMRHDIKVYASPEPRCQQSAAAFCKGFLRLDSPLPPIIATLVHTDDWSRPGDLGKEYVDKAEGEQGDGDEEAAPKIKSKNAIASILDISWATLQEMHVGLCVAECLHSFDTATAAVRALQSHLQQLQRALQEKGSINGPLCGAETPALLLERYRDASGDLGNKEAPRLDKVSAVLENLRHDKRHNQVTFPELATEALDMALPLCEALCDVTAYLEATTDQQGHPHRKQLSMLHKLRDDLRIASGTHPAHKAAHPEKYELHFAAVSAGQNGELQLPLRTRLYHTHNSQLQGLLNLILRSGLMEDSSKCPSVHELARLDFLAHVSMQLRRRQSDNSLHVSCAFAKSHSDHQTQLFDKPVDEVETWLSQAIEAF